MVTPCPNCKRQVEHEDYLFEVLCECGSRFNPFMNLSEPPPLDGVEMPSPPETPVAMAWQPPTPGGFAESEAVFEELKKFAEGSLPQTPNAPAPSSSSPSSAPLSSPLPSGNESTAAALFTSGDSLPGYRIDTYLPPVSAITELDPTANPLGKGFEALCREAAAKGANAVVAVRWVLSPDGTRVILSGTPVQCTKEVA